MPTVYFRIAAREPFEPERAPALERLIARADVRSSVVAWRREAYRLVAPQAGEPPPIATAQLRARGDSRTSGWAMLATPVHLVAGMRDVHLPQGGILEIEAAEAERLAADFNRTFEGGGVHLMRGLAGALICVFDSPLAVQTASPEEALGGDIYEHQPRGADAGALRRLSSEIEMWLFGHAVNAARAARGASSVSALWLWGGGAADATVPATDAWTAGDDVLFSTLDLQPSYPRAGGSGAARSGVVVLSAWPGAPGWQEAEKSWVEPAFADLRAGRLRRIEICAAATSFGISARGLARFWRRRRPWWESFGLEAELPQDGHVGD